MPQVTVIIPAYNAEAYIERCVRSILAQTHRALRLLVVDDGSTDRTGAILDALAAGQSRLHRKSGNGAPVKGQVAVVVHQGLFELGEMPGIKLRLAVQ